MTTKAGSTVHGPDFIALQCQILSPRSSSGSRRLGLFPCRSRPQGQSCSPPSQFPLRITNLRSISRLRVGSVGELRSGCTPTTPRLSCARLRKHDCSESFRSQRMANFGRSFPSPIRMAYAIVAHDGR